MSILSLHELADEIRAFKAARPESQVAAHRGKIADDINPRIGPREQFVPGPDGRASINHVRSGFIRPDERPLMVDELIAR